MATKLNVCFSEKNGLMVFAFRNAMPILLVSSFCILSGCMSRNAKIIAFDHKVSAGGYHPDMNTTQAEIGPPDYQKDLSRILDEIGESPYKDEGWDPDRGIWRIRKYAKELGYDPDHKNQWPHVPLVWIYWAVNYDDPWSLWRGAEMLVFVDGKCVGTEVIKMTKKGYEEAKRRAATLDKVRSQPADLSEPSKQKAP